FEFARLLADDTEKFEKTSKARQIPLWSAALERQFCVDLRPTVAFFSHETVRRYKHILEKDLVEVTLTREVRDGSDGETRRLHVDYQLAQSAVSCLVFTRPDECDHAIGDVRVRRPDLLTIDDEAAVCALGASPY